MAEDRRELILNRLVDLFCELTEKDNVFRNKTEIPEDKRPGFVILDADEVALEPEVARRGRPSDGPVIVGMSPEIIVLVQDDVEKVGSVLSEWRATVLKAVTQDAELKALCTEIRYEGFTTALAIGRSMEGQARINFTFVYVLKISQL